MRLRQGRRVNEKPLRRGDVVALRSPREILETLDETGSLDGVPFMPEMLGYFAGTSTVAKRVERACDAVSRSRRMPDTVLLDDLRCDGSGHDGCQAGCRLYWKEAWLQRVPKGGGRATVAADAALDELRRIAEQNARVFDGDAGGQTKYRCQATEFLRSSELIPFWDARSLLREVTSRNVTPWTFLRVVAGIIGNEPRRRYKGQRPFKTGGSGRVPTDSVDLQAGSKVRIRSASEIADTLDENSKLRGLWFDREMLPYCGTRTTVKTKVDRFIDETSGEMVGITSDCFILEGVVCKGQISDGRWFCCREIYPWWREAWLELDTDAPR